MKSGRAMWRRGDPVAARLRRWRMASILSTLVVASLTFLALTVEATAVDDSAGPLTPVDRSSPRATVQSFLGEMNAAVDAYLAGRHDKAQASLDRAERCLNLSGQPDAVRRVMGFYSVLYLKEVLDRIPLPRVDEIPDAGTVESEKLSYWTIPHTEITVAKTKDETGLDVFEFTPYTVGRLEDFYNRVRSLPYEPGKKGALYDRLSEASGLILPKDFAENLPGWARKEVLGESVWQWIGLSLYILIGGAAALLVHFGGRRALASLDRKSGADFSPHVSPLFPPLIMVIYAQVGLWLVVYGLHFLRADVYLPIALAFLTVSYLGVVWLIGALLNRAASLVIYLSGAPSAGMSAQLIRLGFDVVTAVILAAMIIKLGARLGLPTYSLVAGLGIGGVAVALAGKEALSNLVGTLVILLDHPFKLGHYIVVGEGDRGAVTEIGLRSTRIRTRDGILLSIPNSMVANMKIVNESEPVAKARIRVPIGVGYGSALEEVDSALLSASERCEYVEADPPPSVRLIQFGDSSIQFELFVWISRPEYRGRAINQLNRAIYDELTKKGIEIPFPQRDVHIRKDA